MTNEEVVTAVEERDVRFIRLWFTDILGQLKSFSITRDEVGSALEHGMGFDGSSITGFNAIEESDVVAMPDPSTFAILPYRPRERAVARMFCDIRLPGGEPYEGDPRHVLRRALARAESMGFDHFYLSPELEYFYFRSSDAPDVLDRGGYFDLTTLDAASDLRRDTVMALEEIGIAIEYSHHEVGPSQHEIDMRYDDALRMADNVMTYRTIVKEIAHAHGCYATFMPKPLSDENGSGMHTHQSLFRGDQNAFYDPDGEDLLSADGKAFVAGLLRHAREISCVFAQWVNSYKRLVPGFEAPVYVAWSRRNRSAMVRVPMHRPGQERDDAGRAALPRSGLQPVPDLRRPASRRAGGDREGLRAAPADGDQPLRPDPRGAGARRHRQPARDPGRGHRAGRRQRAAPEVPGRAHPFPLRRAEARGVGGLPRAGHPLRGRALPAAAVSETGAVGLTARGPFRLEAVAISHGWFQTAPFSWDPRDRVLQRVEPLGTLRIESAEGGVRVSAAAPLGAEVRPAVAARVTRMLQLDADLTGFPDAVRVVDRRLARDLVGYGGGRILAGGSLFEDVVKGICGTNTTWTQAVTAINRIASLGPGGAFPGPADVLRAGEDWLRAEARVGYRAPAIVAASRSAIDGTLAEIDGGLGRRRHRPHRGRPAAAGRHRTRHLRVPAAADGPLRPPLDRLGHAAGGVARVVRRAPPHPARGAPAGGAGGPLLRPGAGVVHAACLAARDRAHPLSAPAAGFATRSSRARQRPAQASQVCSAAHAAPVRPSTSRSAGSEASRASCRA